MWLFERRGTAVGNALPDYQSLRRRQRRGSRQPCCVFQRVSPLLCLNVWLRTAQCEHDATQPAQIGRNHHALSDAVV